MTMEDRERYEARQRQNPQSRHLKEDSKLGDRPGGRVGDVHQNQRKTWRTGQQVSSSSVWGL